MININDLKGKIKPAHIILVFFLLLKLIISLFPVQYGIFRDEFYFIAMSENLDFGYLDVPPLAPFLLSIVRLVFGVSYFSLHILPAIGGCVIIFLIYKIVNELDGNLFAIILALTAVTLSPQLSAITSFYSYEYLDMLFWVLTMYFIFKLIKTENMNYWIYFGIAAGFGLLSKITMLFLGFSILIAFLVTKNRKFLLKWKFLLGGIIALTIFLPYIIWQLLNGIPAIEYYTNYASGKAAGTDPINYLLNHIITMNPVACIVWLAGIFYFFFNKNGKKYRVFGILFFLLSIISILTKSKYYLSSPVFLILFTGGSVFTGELFEKTKNKFLHFLKYYYLVNVFLIGIFILPVVRPVLPVETLAKTMALTSLGKHIRFENHEYNELPQILADRFGWPELADKINIAYLSLPVNERGKCVIITDNYGEAGAIEHLGKKYNLPKPISGHLQYYIWGNRGYSGEIAIVVTGASENEIHAFYEEVKRIDHGLHKYAMPYENNTSIYICKKPKMSSGKMIETIKHFD